MWLTWQNTSAWDDIEPKAAAITSRVTSSEPDDITIYRHEVTASVVYEDDGDEDKRHPQRVGQTRWGQAGPEREAQDPDAVSASLYISFALTGCLHQHQMNSMSVCAGDELAPN